MCSSFLFALVLSGDFCVAPLLFVILLSLHCVFIGQVACSLSSAQAKGRDVVNQAGDACITSFPCATATVLCSLWQEPSQVSQHSSLGKRNNVHLQFARPTLDAYCSTKCAFVNQIGLTGKLVKFWELYGSVAAPMSIDQPLVTATAIIVIITCFILFGNFHIHQTCKPQSQVDNKVTIVHNIIALAIKRCWMREINLTRRAWTKLTPTSETKLNQVHLDQPLPT